MNKKILKVIDNIDGHIQCVKNSAMIASEPLDKLNGELSAFGMAKIIICREYKITIKNVPYTDRVCDGYYGILKKKV